MPHNRQFFTASHRGVFNVVVCIQVDHKDIVVVGGKGLCDISIGFPLIRIRDG